MNNPRPAGPALDKWESALQKQTLEQALISELVSWNLPQEFRELKHMDTFTVFGMQYLADQYNNNKVTICCKVAAHCRHHGMIPPRTED